MEMNLKSTVFSHHVQVLIHSTTMHTVKWSLSSRSIAGYIHMLSGISHAYFLMSTVFEASWLHFLNLKQIIFYSSSHISSKCLLSFNTFMYKLL